MKYIYCFIIYTIVQYFKQIAGVVESKYNIFISVIVQRAFIFGLFKSTAYSFLADTMPESRMVKLYIFTHLIKYTVYPELEQGIFHACLTTKNIKEITYMN